MKDLSSQEICNLKSFICSPYFNKSKRIINLFNELKKFYPSFNSNKVNKEYLHQRISPGLKYNDSTFRNLIADLHSLIERFLIIEQLFESDVEKNILLMKSLINKGQSNQFYNCLKKTSNLLESNGEESNYYYSKSLIELCKFNNCIINESQKTRIHVKNNVEILKRYIIYSINFFITELINSHLKLSIESQKFNVNETSFSTEIISIMDIAKLIEIVKKVDKNNFVLDLYLKLFLAFHNSDNIKRYDDYKSLVTKHFNRLSKDEQSYHYSMLISYNVIKKAYNNTKNCNDIELFKLYNTFLKEELFFDDKSNFIDESLFRNILILSLRLQKFDWTDVYISKYSQYLHPIKKMNIVNLSYAEYFYHKGTIKKSKDYLNAAFEYLSKIREDSFIIKYDIKILYLMLYYDLGYIENLLCLLKNFRQFLWRNKLVPKERKIKLNKFLNILEKMVYLNEGDPHIDATNLYLEIIYFQNFNYQGWLLNKIQKFTNKKAQLKIKLG
ncbi:MAG: hypothetical protein JSS91_09080 [Bacteroidetes bacterium]|nr:hypothetical protein [Bacteroidota bacterium]